MPGIKAHRMDLLQALWSKTVLSTRIAEEAGCQLPWLRLEDVLTDFSLVDFYFIRYLEFLQQPEDALRPGLVEMLSCGAVSFSEGNKLGVDRKAYVKNEDHIQKGFSCFSSLRTCIVRVGLVATSVGSRHRDLAFFRRVRTAGSLSLKSTFPSAKTASALSHAEGAYLENSRLSIYDVEFMADLGRIHFIANCWIWARTRWLARRTRERSVILFYKRARRRRIC